MNKNQNKKKREQEAKTELAQKIANQSQKVAMDMPVWRKTSCVFSEASLLSSIRFYLIRSTAS